MIYCSRRDSADDFVKTVGIQARAYHGGNTAANADVLKDFCATPRMSGMVPNVCVR